MGVAAEMLVRIGADTKDVDRAVAHVTGTSLTSLEKRIAASAQRMQAIGAGMTLGITAPIVGTGVAVAKLTMDFDSNMARIRAATGATGTDLVLLRDAALSTRRALQTGVAPAETQEGIVELGKAGMDAATILRGPLDGALRLAAAGEIKVGEAAGIGVKAMSQFNLTAEQFPRIADVLAQGANESTADIADLAQALQMAGNVAGQGFNYTLEETIATLAAFDNAGLRGSDSGTSLKTMLLNLNPTAKKSRDEMERLGISFVRADGSFMHMAEVAGVLQEKLSGLSDAQRDEALKTMFGADAVRAATILYKLGAKGVEDWTTRVAQSGAALQTAITKTDSFAGGMRKIWAAGQVEAIKFGDAVMQEARPALNTFMDEIQRAADDGTLDRLAADTAKTAISMGQSLGTLVQTAGSLAQAFAGAPKPARDLALYLVAIGAAAGPVLTLTGGVVRVGEALYSASKHGVTWLTTGRQMGGVLTAVKAAVLQESAAEYQAAQARVAATKATLDRIRASATATAESKRAAAALHAEAQAEVRRVGAGLAASVKAAQAQAALAQETLRQAQTAQVAAQSAFEHTFALDRFTDAQIRARMQTYGAAEANLRKAQTDAAAADTTLAKARAEMQAAREAGLEAAATGKLATEEGRLIQLRIEAAQATLQEAEVQQRRAAITLEEAEADNLRAAAAARATLATREGTLAEGQQVVATQEGAKARVAEAVAADQQAASELAAANAAKANMGVMAVLGPMMGYATAAVVASVVAWEGYKYAVNAGARAAEAHRLTIEGEMTELRKQDYVLKNAARDYEQLKGKKSLTADEADRLKKAEDILRGYVDGVSVAIDKQTGKLVVNTAALDQNRVAVDRKSKKQREYEIAQTHEELAKLKAERQTGGVASIGKTLLWGPGNAGPGTTTDTRTLAEMDARAKKIAMLEEKLKSLQGEATSAAARTDAALQRMAKGLESYGAKSYAELKAKLAKAGPNSDFFRQVVRDALEATKSQDPAVRQRGMDIIKALAEWMERAKPEVQQAAEMTVATVKQEMDEFEPMAKEYGYGAGKAWADGLAASSPYVKQKVEVWMQPVVAATKTHSPPKAGPLKDIDRWGKGLVHAWADGMVAGIPYVTAATTRMTRAAAVLLQPPVVRMGGVRIAPVRTDDVGGIQDRARASLDWLTRWEKTHAPSERGGPIDSAFKDEMARGLADLERAQAGLRTAGTAEERARLRAEVLAAAQRLKNARDLRNEELYWTGLIENKERQRDRARSDRQRERLDRDVSYLERMQERALADVRRRGDLALMYLQQEGDARSATDAASLRAMDLRIERSRAMHALEVQRSRMAEDLAGTAQDLAVRRVASLLGGNGGESLNAQQDLLKARRDATRQEADAVAESREAYRVLLSDLASARGETLATTQQWVVDQIGAGTAPPEVTTWLAKRTAALEKIGGELQRQELEIGERIAMADLQERKGRMADVLFGGIFESSEAKRLYERGQQDLGRLLAGGAYALPTTSAPAVPGYGVTPLPAPASGAGRLVLEVRLNDDMLEARIADGSAAVVDAYVLAETAKLRGGVGQTR